MYKLADEHLTTLTENLHKVIGDACKTYTEDAIIRFKQEVYQLFDPAETDDIKNMVAFSTNKTGKISVENTRWNAWWCDDSCGCAYDAPKVEVVLQTGEEIAMAHYAVGTGILITGTCVSMQNLTRILVTNLGNLYFQTVEYNPSSRFCNQVNNVRAKISSKTHFTNTQLSPLFESILINAVTGLGANSRIEGFKNLLDMNRKYYYLLAKDAGGEILRREKELAQKATTSAETAADFEAKYNAEYERRRAVESELAALREKVRALVG
jgi:hypothetical protein